MHQGASVRFHMYTVKKFLDYAQNFFSLKAEPASKAAAEFDELEKASEQIKNVGRPYNVFLDSAWSPGWTSAIPYSIQQAWQATPPDSPGQIQVASVAFNPDKACISQSCFLRSAGEQASHNDLVRLPLRGMEFQDFARQLALKGAASCSENKGSVTYLLEFEPLDHLGESAVWHCLYRLTN